MQCRRWCRCADLRVVHDREFITASAFHKLHRLKKNKFLSFCQHNLSSLPLEISPVLTPRLPIPIPEAKSLTGLVSQHKHSDSQLDQRQGSGSHPLAPQIPLEDSGPNSHEQLPCKAVQDLGFPDQVQQRLEMTRSKLNDIAEGREGEPEPSLAADAESAPVAGEGVRRKSQRARRDKGHEATKLKNDFVGASTKSARRAKDYYKEIEIAPDEDTEVLDRGSSIPNASTGFPATLRNLIKRKS